MTSINQAEVNKLFATTTVLPENSVVDNRLTAAISGNSTDNSLPIDKKTKRKNELLQTANEYGVQLKDIENFLVKSLHLNNIDEFYNLSEQEYVNIEATFLQSSLETLIERKNKKITAQDLEDLAQKNSSHIDSGATTEQIQELNCEYGSSDLFQILKKESKELKKFSSLDDIKTPEDKNILQNSIKQFFDTHGSDKKNINDYLELLHRTKTKNEEMYTLLYNSARDAIEENQQYNLLISTIKQYKNPAELDKLMSNENIKFILTCSGISTGEVKDVMSSLNDALESNEEIHNAVMSRANTVISVLLNAIELAKTLPENQMTQEQKNLLNNENLITNNSAAMASMVAIFAKTDDIKTATIAMAEKYGISEKVFEEAYKYAQGHPELDISKIFDDLTGGKYSKFVDDTYNKPAQSADVSGSGGGDFGIGLPQKNITSEFVENLQASISDKNSALKEKIDKNFEFVKNDPAKSKKGGETKSNIILESYDTIIKKMAAGIYDTKDVFSRCTANLNNGIGKVVLKLFDGYKSVADRSNHLNMLGSFIARGKVIHKCGYNYSELEGNVVLTSDQKKLINENENKKEPS